MNRLNESQLKLRKYRCWVPVVDQKVKLWTFREEHSFKMSHLHKVKVYYKSLINRRVHVYHDGFVYSVPETDISGPKVTLPVRGSETPELLLFLVR